MRMAVLELNQSGVEYVHEEGLTRPGASPHVDATLDSSVRVWAD